MNGGHSPSTSIAKNLSKSSYSLWGMIYLRIVWYSDPHIWTASLFEVLTFLKVFRSGTLSCSFMHAFCAFFQSIMSHFCVLRRPQYLPQEFLL